MSWGIPSGFRGNDAQDERGSSRHKRKNFAGGFNHSIEKRKEQKEQQAESDAQKRSADAGETERRVEPFQKRNEEKECGETQHAKNQSGKKRKMSGAKSGDGGCEKAGEQRPGKCVTAACEPFRGH